jgi:nitronate monooxygenase
MAGGPSTVALAGAVCGAGALGFLAGGYLPVRALGEQIDALRSQSANPFGVNLFVPPTAPTEPATLKEYLAEIEPEARLQGTELDEPRFDDDGWEAKLALLTVKRPPVVSFTFGCPAADVIDALHDGQISVWVTVTNVDEALLAVAAGADALILQGIEAGGHRSTFGDQDESGHGLLALLRLVARRVELPLVAAGAITDGQALAAVLCAGASAAQIGTALMLSPEAGTPGALREVMLEHYPTRLTRAFTGRLARGIVNRFMREHDASAPSAYPQIHNATGPLRARARERGDHDAFNLWAGEAHELAQARTVGEIIGEMHVEARARLQELTEGNS